MRASFTPVAAARMVEGSRSPLEDEILAMFEDREAPFNRDLFTLQDLRFSLKLRVPSFASTSLRRLAAVVTVEPIRAQKIALRPRSTDAQGKPIRQNYWALRNAEIWTDASNEDILRHLQTGTPLLRAVPEVLADSGGTILKPTFTVAQPLEKASPEPSVEPAVGGE